MSLVPCLTRLEYVDKLVSMVASLEITALQ